MNRKLNVGDKMIVIAKSNDDEMSDLVDCISGTLVKETKRLLLVQLENKMKPTQIKRHE